jgi:hypothetical protein
MARHHLCTISPARPADPPAPTGLDLLPRHRGGRSTRTDASPLSLVTAWQSCQAVPGWVVVVVLGGLGWLWLEHRWILYTGAVVLMHVLALVVWRRRRLAVHRREVVTVWAGIAAATGHLEGREPDPRHERWLTIPGPGRRIPESRAAGRLAGRIIRAGRRGRTERRLAGRVVVRGRASTERVREGRVPRWLHRRLMARALRACVIHGHVRRTKAFSPETARTIRNVLNTVYPRADLDVAIDPVGATWIAFPTPRPPASARFADLIDAMDATSITRPLIALGTGGKPVYLDLIDENPHVAFSMGTGAGKSSTLRTIIAQLYRHGAQRIYIIDPKQISLDAFKGIPGIKICRSVESQIEAVEEFYAEMVKRYEVLAEDSTATFTRWFLVMEEMNSWTDIVAIHWRKVRDRGDPKTHPVMSTVGLITYQARQAGMHVFMSLQQANTKAMGGSALRDQFGAVLLARFSANAWDMLSGGLRPRPRSSRHPGRAVLKIADDVSTVQLVFTPAADARAYALSRWAGGQAPRMVEPAAPVTVTVDRDIPASVGTGALPVTVATVTGADRDEGRALDEPARLTLPDACRTGVLALNPDAARAARMRDPEFPAGRGEGRNQTYTEDELRRWYNNRAKVG